MSWPDQDFLLTTATARRLYHEVAAGLPIVDYHCHLDPADLTSDRRFANLAELWVIGDPYKHRAMRIAGVPEALITGKKTSAREKFDAWAATVPKTLGNPLFDWSALELKRYFGITQRLGPETSEAIWQAAKERLGEPGMSARGLLQRAGVECVCTSDRLLDDLTPHAQLVGWSTRVLPSLRGDDVLATRQAAFGEWLDELGTSIDSYAAFVAAVRLRLDLFAARGCRLADHGIDVFRYVPVAEGEVAALFGRRLKGEGLSEDESVRLESGLLRMLGQEYASRGWVLQLHLGAQRNTSTGLRTLAGPAGGYAAIGPTCDVAALCRFLDDLEREGALPRVVLYSLNPADFPVLATLTGSYAEDGTAGKIQCGPAWWWNDHAQGIRSHLQTLASYGLLSTFIGMTTDSRSLLSMVRHEYFRRLLCGFVGEQVESGAWPADAALLEGLVRAVSYGNAKQMLAKESHG